MRQINSNARFLWGKADYEMIVNAVPGTNSLIQIPRRPLRSQPPSDADSYEVSLVRYKRHITCRNPRRINQGRICLTCEEFEIDSAIERLAEALRSEVTAAKCKFHAQIRVLGTDDWQSAISWRITGSSSMDRLLRLVMCGDVIASGLWRGTWGLYGVGLFGSLAVGELLIVGWTENTASFSVSCHRVSTQGCLDW